MAANLWNTQSPTKRIDLYFKIDDYKKHLLSLKNAKSAFKKTLPFFFPKNNDLDRNRISSSKPRKPLSELTHLRLREKSFDLSQSKMSLLRENTDTAQSQRKNSGVTLNNSRLDCSKLNFSMFSSTTSPKKITNFKDWQINQNNKKILKKLEGMRASPQLSKKKLFHKYSMSDLKYKMNLQKTRCNYCLDKDKNVDFTKAAEKLLRGEKIKFNKIRMGSVQNEDPKENQKEKIKVDEANLNWKLSRTLIPVSITHSVNLVKELR